MPNSCPRRRPRSKWANAIARRDATGLELGLWIVAIAMARSGGHWLTDAIVRSVGLVGGIRVEVVRQTSTHVPVQTKQRRPARVNGSDVEVHVVVEYGAHIPEVAAEVQRRVIEYLGRMADVRPATVDVVVDDVKAH